MTAIGLKVKSDNFQISQCKIKDNIKLKSKIKGQREHEFENIGLTSGFNERIS